ncbi:ABC transporter [[Eubacterium] yurii]|jgi:hypothetical protein|nr:ABC transporter [[Eubacterium] yurii]
MEKLINIWGIETNNLKNIDIQIEQNAINLIIGPSGSGKSSLAYDTIAQIGQHEFMSMFADDIFEPTYQIKGYENMLAAVPIKQSNFNNNTRSTIGTYFGINKDIIFIYAAILCVNEEFFVLNKEANLCEKCHGLGSVKILDQNKIINYDISLNKNPFRCWNRYKDFYQQILHQFCATKGIDDKKNFRQLTDKEKKLILYGESNEKYSIRYKKSNNFSRRSTRYYGVMTGKPMMVNYLPSEQFYTYETCKYCQGKKYSLQHEKFSLNGLSIGDFMTLPFEELLGYIERLIKENIDNDVLFAINNIYKFIVKAIELNLGHLFFHRTIPTLSGGELQRLRMVQVLNTQLSNLLLVLDEPLAGLSGNEKKSVFQSITELAKANTVVIVDHSDIFVKSSKRIIALGEMSGINGGYIIDPMKYLAKQNVRKKMKVFPLKKSNHINIKNSIYFYKGVNLEIGENCMNLITGSSGIGKSTLLREYFPQYYENYLYISQKPLVGNKNSSVSTAIGIFSHISNLFAVKYKKDKKFFSNQTGCEGMCEVCMGSGYIEFGSSYDSKIKLECRECGGTGFNKKIQKYKLLGKSLFDVWNMTIDEAIKYFDDIDRKISDALNESSSILLGHLKIGQPISKLSGGENIRIKLLKAIKSTSKVFGIDEPFKGLNNTEIYQVVQYLDRLRGKDKTIIVVDHSDNVEQYFAKHIELICVDGILKDINQD